MHTPYIIERNEGYERVYDIYSKLLNFWYYIIINNSKGVDNVKNDIKLIFEDGQEMLLSRGVTVREVLKLLGNDQIIALRVNGNAQNADYEIMEDAYIFQYI